MLLFVPSSKLLGMILLLGRGCVGCCNICSAKADEALPVPETSGDES